MPQVTYIVYKNPTLFLDADDLDQNNCSNSMISSDVVSIVSDQLLYGSNLVTAYFKSYKV